MATIENGSTKTQGREIAEAMYARLFQGAREIVASGQEHAPILIIENDYGPAVILGGHEFQGKDHMAYAHRSVMDVKGVRAAALIMEGWVYMGSDEKIARAIMEGQLAVRDLPEKSEALIFSIRAAGEQYLAMCKIDRATNSVEQAALFDPTGKANPEQRAEGRFIGDGNTEAQAARRRAN